MKRRIQLDPYPIPKDSKPLFINAPWLIDATYDNYEYDLVKEDGTEEDNRRVYVPLDLNKSAILRRLDDIIRRYGEASERNELDFESDVRRLLYQVEIYDRVWYVRHMPEEGNHSLEAIDLMREFVKRLEEIPDGCAECFPYEMIDELKAEYS